MAKYQYKANQLFPGLIFRKDLDLITDCWHTVAGISNYNKSLIFSSKLTGEEIKEIRSFIQKEDLLKENKQKMIFLF